MIKPMTNAEFKERIKGICGIRPANPLVTRTPNDRRISSPGSRSCRALARSDGQSGGTMNHLPDEAGHCPECGINLDYAKCHCFDELAPIPGTDTLVPEGDHGIVLDHPLKKHFPAPAFPSLLESAEHERHVDLGTFEVFPLMLEDLKLFEQCVARRARKPHRCCATRGLDQDVTEHVTIRHRISCAVTIQPGERYIEYFGETPPYQSGHRFHIECARREGLVL